MENTFPSDYDDALLYLIHEDVLIQILVWLPIKSLLRFKSVNKSWRALVESSFFIHLHEVTTTTTSSSNQFGTFIFQTSPYKRSHYFYPKATDFFMLSSSSRSDDGDEEDDEVFVVEDLEPPPLLSNLVSSTRRPKLLMVGSCNGIVCLYDYDSSLGDVSLWNPATRQFRLLPTSLKSVKDINRPYEYHDFVGFGFDVKTKDYKVVKITFCEDYILGVQVYSLSTDSWRLLEGGGGGSGLNPLFAKQVDGLNREHGLYLNGSYFFEGINYQDDQIYHSMISFDFTQEIFTIMQFPDEYDPDSTLIAITTYLGENIALLTRSGEHDYDIWVLNEHHGGSSSSSSGSLNKELCWTKLQQHSFQMERRNGIMWQTTIPRGISNDGEFALIENRGYGYRVDRFKLQLFNLVTKEASIEFQMEKELERADVYKPSLVSINGGNGVTAANMVIGGAM